MFLASDPWPDDQSIFDLRFVADLLGGTSRLARAFAS